MKLVVTGSRDWEDWAHVWRTLDSFTAYCTGDVWLVHGDCESGADTHADDWGLLNLGGERIKRYPADWSQGRSAGPARNRLMLREHRDADYVLAFPLGASQGTRGCMKYATELGLTVINLGEKK